MKQNQKGFTVVEILLVILLMGLIVGGFFIVKKARHNISTTVTSNQSDAVPNRKEKAEGSAIAYTGQAECDQDGPDSLDALRGKGPGLYVGVEQTFEVNDPNANKEDSLNTPTNASMKTTDTVYPLVLDTTNSSLDTNRASFVFNFVTTPKEVATSLTNTNATISYNLKDKTYTTPAFTIDSCVIE